MEKIAEFFKARGDMAVGDGKMLLLSWMRAAEDAIARLSVLPVPAGEIALRSEVIAILSRGQQTAEDIYIDTCEDE